MDGGIKLDQILHLQKQARRFEARIEDPLRQWKLSPMDVEWWLVGTIIPAPAT